MTQTAAARAAYQRSWRVAHPAYDRNRRATKRVLLARQQRAWRVANPVLMAAMRRRYAARHPAVPAAPVEPIPDLHQGHPLLDLARCLVPDHAEPMSVYQSLVELDHEDARSEAVLAMLTGQDPLGAARRYLSAEASWRRFTAPLFEGAA